jgi:hypothetical protein
MSQRPGTGSAWTDPSASGARSHDHQLFVKRPELTLSFARRCPQPLYGAQRRQCVELVGEYRRVDHERLVRHLRRDATSPLSIATLPGATPHDHAVDLQQSARDHQHVAMERDGPHG